MILSVVRQQLTDYNRCASTNLCKEFYNRSDKCLESEGEYIEHLLTL